MPVRKNKANLGLPALFIALALALICGCSVVETIPQADQVLKMPLGTESIRIGMTKQEVESHWGKPDSVQTVENKKRWSGPRDMWVYRANYGSIPVDAGYLSKTKKLYFDGANLTEIE